MKALIAPFKNRLVVRGQTQFGGASVLASRRHFLWLRRIAAGEAAHPTNPISVRTAFTLIELLVVIATMAVLAVMLLPALAGTQVQSKTTACTARFRQWAVSHNLYASDNRGWLASLYNGVDGSYAWDVGNTMCNILYPYGLDVPDWFCPTRPTQWDAANQWMQGLYGHPVQKITDLTLYLGRNVPEHLVINDNYWVPRTTMGGYTFPTDYSGKLFPPPWIKTSNPTSLTYGWPRRLHDIAVPYVPFVSDSAGSGQVSGLHSPSPASPYVTNLAPNTAHFVNGTLIGVNLAFADGHVVNHTPDQMRAAYYDGANYWFY